MANAEKRKEIEHALVAKHGPEGLERYMTDIAFLEEHAERVEQVRDRIKAVHAHFSDLKKQKDFGILQTDIERKFAAIDQPWRSLEEICALVFEKEAADWEHDAARFMAISLKYEMRIQSLIPYLAKD